jgi:16S rRNA (cytosine1402-N4)-methyltransferase
MTNLNSHHKNKSSLSAKGSGTKHGRIGSREAARPDGGQKTRSYHTPVLLKETLKALSVHSNLWYIDCTLGGGGHTKALLKAGAKVLAIDRDQDAIDHTTQNLEKHIKNNTLILVKDNFINIDKICQKHEIKPDGILFDLGVSSHQIDGNKRGFSFQVDESLDMRMDRQNQTVTARNLVNGLYVKELEKLISNYGEDNLAKDISREIVRKRKERPIETTGQLQKIIAAVYRRRYTRSSSEKNPATKTFQALRIVVNDEINNLKLGLESAFKILKADGRIVIITFHGLEESVVNNQLLTWEKNQLGKIINNNPIIASDKELGQNPRSRSAKLKVFLKS